VTVILAGETLETREIRDSGESVTAQWDAWEAPEFVRKLRGFGWVQGWTLICYESGVAWADSSARKLRESMATGEAVPLIISMGSRLAVNTKVHILSVDVTYDRPMDPTASYREFAVVVQEAKGKALRELVLELRMDGNLVDSSKYENHGVGYGGPDFAAGKKGSALRIDADNEYAEVPHSASLTFKNRPSTICFWFKPAHTLDDVQGDGEHRWYTFLQKGDDPYTNPFTIVYDQAWGVLYLYINSGDGWYCTVRNFTADTWYHLLLIIDDENKTAQLFIDNEEQTWSENHPDSIPENTKPLRISQPGDHTYAGLIDQLEVYNYALSAAERESRWRWAL